MKSKDYLPISERKIMMNCLIRYVREHWPGLTYTQVRRGFSYTANKLNQEEGKELYERITGQC